MPLYTRKPLFHSVAVRTTGSEPHTLVPSQNEQAHVRDAHRSGDVCSELVVHVEDLATGGMLMKGNHIVQ
jgi:hypothetical protein